jgi:hypothetical protein
MNARLLFSRVLLVIGLAGMLIGAVDPLEGSLLILPGVGLVALGAHLGKSPWRKLLDWSFVLVAVGVGAMVVLSWLGGIGGNTGRSMWWALVLAPYPVGWTMGLAGGVLLLTEHFRLAAAPK